MLVCIIRHRHAMLSKPVNKSVNSRNIRVGGLPNIEYRPLSLQHLWKRLDLQFKADFGSILVEGAPLETELAYKGR